MEVRLEVGPGHRPDDAADLRRGPLGPVDVDDPADDEIGDRVERSLLDDELTLDPLVEAGPLGLLAVDQERILVELARRFGRGGELEPEVGLLQLVVARASR